MSYNLDPRIVEGREIKIIARNDETGAKIRETTGLFRGFKGGIINMMPTLLVDRDGEILEIDTFNTEDWGMDGDVFYVVDYFDTSY